MTIPEAIATARKAHRIITDAARALSANDECRSGLGYLLNLATAARVLADEVHRLSEEVAVLRVSDADLVREHRALHLRHAQEHLGHLGVKLGFARELHRLDIRLQVARCGWLEEAAAKEHSRLPKNALASDIHRLEAWAAAARFRRGALEGDPGVLGVLRQMEELHP